MFHVHIIAHAQTRYLVLNHVYDSIYREVIHDSITNNNL